MDQEQEEAVTTPVDAPSVKHGGNPAYPPSRLRGLMPPWRPGVSGNPSGLSSDGKGTKSHAIEARLLAQLGAPSGKRSTKTWSERIVDGWLKAAAKGDPAARRDILERLYPVPKDAQQGRQILEGLKLELTPQGASLTMARTETPIPDPANGGTSNGVVLAAGPSLPFSPGSQNGIDVELAQPAGGGVSGGESDAESVASESRGETSNAHVPSQGASLAGVPSSKHSEISEGDSRASSLHSGTQETPVGPTEGI